MLLAHHLVAVEGDQVGAVRYLGQSGGHVRAFRPDGHGLLDALQLLTIRLGTIILGVDGSGEQGDHRKHQSVETHRAPP